MVTATDRIEPLTPAFFRLEMSAAVSLLVLVSYDLSADASLEVRHVGRNP